MDNQYVTPSGYKKWSAALMIIGGLTLILGIIFLSPGSGANYDNLNGTRFWAVLLQNSVFWLMLVNIAAFFIVINTLAMSGWQEAFRRVTEAVSSLVPLMSVITMVIFLCIILGHRGDIYPWLDKHAVAHDHVLNGKKGFLNPAVFLIYSAITLFLWSYWGKKLRTLSLKSDEEEMDYETAKLFHKKMSSISAYYVVFFVVSAGSIIPWLWMMSIDAHWYSTMYSWYTFGSTFVSGIALLTLFVIYFKNRGQLPFVNKEHIQDLGKYMFAFSIFWTYLWFAQFMLQWYSNIPEETIYFKIRLQGPYEGIFYLNLVLNFVAPFLIFMKRATKRNYFIVTFMCIVIIFGHWIDFYQMVIPGTLGLHPHLSWFEFGIPLGFVGLIMWGVNRFATKVAMTPRNNPFLKESIIHFV